MIIIGEPGPEGKTPKTLWGKEDHKNWEKVRKRKRINRKNENGRKKRSRIYGKKRDEMKGMPKRKGIEKMKKVFCVVQEKKKAFFNLCKDF